MADKRVALLKRANKLFRAGKAEAAVKEYNKILAIKPDDLEVRRIIGDLELRQNNIRESVEQFEWIADYYLKEGFFAKAIAMFKRITRVDPGYEQALFKLADLYTKQGLVMEAKQIFLDIAEECKRQNNQKKALDMYKKILEFDRSNIKMRLLLADNYLKEGLEGDAVAEYLTAADILLNKRDHRRVEELLLNTTKKVKNIKLIEKLIYFYTTNEEDDKAINILKEMGLDVFKNVDLLKVMGELYLKKNLMDEAENIFSKIAEIAPAETEIIMRLGKVYIQREEYDKTYNLFLPIIDKNIGEKKYEEGASLLRFIIASNNSYIPALIKLADIFKLSGKTNNLIALYESMIPIYEGTGQKDELKKILEELIQLSDSPFSYEDQLAKLSGQVAKEAEKEEEVKENEREKEFVEYNLRIVNEALKVSDYNKAVEVLKKAKITFPKNIEIRQKLFQIYLQTERNEMAVDEGKGLLELYKFLGDTDEYTDLLGKLSSLKPEDDKLVELSGEEKTSIDIDFDQAALEEEISDAHMDDGGELDESDILLLSDAENVIQEPLIEHKEATKSLSSVLSEVDFYVNDGYFGDAEKLIDQLKNKYPGNQALLDKIKKLKEAKKDAGKMDESAGDSTGLGFEIERSQVEGVEEARPGRTEQIPRKEANPVEYQYQGQDSSIEIDIGDLDSSSSSGLNLSEEASGAPPLSLDLDLEESAPEYKVEEPLSIPEESVPAFQVEEPTGIPEETSAGFQLDEPLGTDQESNPPFSSPEPELLPEGDDVFELEPSMSPASQNLPQPPVDQTKFEDSSMLKISEEAYASTDSFPPESLADADQEPLSLGDDLDAFEIESSISEESASAQELSDSRIDIKIDPESLKPPEPVPPAPSKVDIPESPTTLQPKPVPQAEPEPDFEIELEDSQQVPDLPEMEVDPDLLIQSPSAAPEDKEKSVDGYTSSVLEEIDLDSIMNSEEAALDQDSPFKEMNAGELDFDAEDEEDLLQGEGLFLEEAYLEIEKNVRQELDAIARWLKELEKQRTSTIEKNMMEIFEEFKKGVDEKIGREDFDTRYNLGIAYKEMGLLEEAIHEFLISSKHPSKFFDSAGLLGMCFREKGMFTEAITWFEKALETPSRRQEEYLAVKYELVITLKVKEDYRSAQKVLEEIIQVAPNYRNVAMLYTEIKAQIP
jgi:tetratricopeptide (TPR) repeat protein